MTPAQIDQKIQNARLKGAKSLTIRDPGSDGSCPFKGHNFPDSLGELKELEDLSLWLLKLGTLPKSLERLTNIRKLDLSGNDLRELAALSSLTEIRELNVSYNELTTLDEPLPNLVQLQQLDASHNDIGTIGDSLGDLIDLRYLNLSDNRLEALPECIRHLTCLETLKLSRNHLTALPDWIGELTSLRDLDLQGNALVSLPDSIGRLARLCSLDLPNNRIVELPDAVSELTNLKEINLSRNSLRSIPATIERLRGLERLFLEDNKLESLPPGLSKVPLQYIRLEHNPLSIELEAAYKQGLTSLRTYLRAQAAAEITISEAKLILVGEGQVGKTCLADALRGVTWQEHETTHGIEIKQFTVNHPEKHTAIALNCWDFGGQRVYRPTHQLFFSAPALYLVVWKPREGAQQNLVKEWITLIKHREPDAKVFVVATHGGPGGRQPDIDRQEIWDIYGRDTVLGFFHVESKPDAEGNRRGIIDLKQAIVRVAASLPDVGRVVPKRWQQLRDTLSKQQEAYLSTERVLEICRENDMSDNEAQVFLGISHRLGYLIHYEHDPVLRDIVVLRPNWLATAISFVLDDEVTRRENRGLISFSRLGQLWNDPARDEYHRYLPEVHPLFLRLMERFDLSYKVVLPGEATDAISFWQRFKDLFAETHKESERARDLNYTSLIAHLVPDVRPESDLGRAWPSTLTVTEGDVQKEQICRIVDEKGASANAEGLFNQLIVRLHKYSLGRENYHRSVHWQRGLVLDDNYNGLALLEYVGNDVRVTVRAPYPERFLAMLTAEIKYLVESFWEGLCCNVMVPCIAPCGKGTPGAGLFEVEKLIASKRLNRTEYPCPVCVNWQDIDSLLQNAPAERATSASGLMENLVVLEEVRATRAMLMGQQTALTELALGQRKLMSQAEELYAGVMNSLTDEAKDGPRLYSFVPVDRANYNPREWTSAKFRLTLWCEHSRLPLPALNGRGSKKGVYELELSRHWLRSAAPYLRLLNGALSIMLPVLASAVKLDVSEATYKEIEAQLDFDKEAIKASFETADKIGETGAGQASDTLEHGDLVSAHGSAMRELHAFLRQKDPGFGGLVRVMNRRQQFLWVHPSFEGEY